MLLFDYLFYKSYKLGVKAKNFGHEPHMAGLYVVGFGMLMHAWTILFIIDGLEIFSVPTFDNSISILIALVWYASFGLFFSIKNVT